MSDHETGFSFDQAFRTQSLNNAIREILGESEEHANAYLGYQYLAAIVGLMRKQRREAGLSQAEIAERLSTTQSAIARLERNTAGSFSVSRFVEYLIACGKQPLLPDVVPATDLIAYSLEGPEAPRTSAVFAEWRDAWRGTRLLPERDWGAEWFEKAESYEDREIPRDASTESIDSTPVCELDFTDPLSGCAEADIASQPVGLVGNDWLVAESAIWKRSAKSLKRDPEQETPASRPHVEHVCQYEVAA